MADTDIDLKYTKYCYKPSLISSKFTSFLEGGLFNTPYYKMTHSCVSFAYTMIEMANPQPGNRQHYINFDCLMLDPCCTCFNDF